MFNLFGGLVKVFMVLVVIGVILGLALSGTDITNIITNSAKAGAINQDTAQKAAQSKIDLPIYQKAQDEKLLNQVKLDEQNLRFNEDNHNLQLKQADQDQQIQLAKSIQDMETGRIVSYIWTGTGAFFVACLGIGIMLAISHYKRATVVIHPDQIRPSETWNNPAWRKERIHSARRTERSLRTGHPQTVDVPETTSPYEGDVYLRWEEPAEGSEK